MVKKRRKDPDAAKNNPGDVRSDDAWVPESTGDTFAAKDERDLIAARAYELYLERGASGGDAMEDWLAAEREFANRSDNRKSRE